MGDSGGEERRKEAENDLACCWVFFFCGSFLLCFLFSFLRYPLSLEKLSGSSLCISKMAVSHMQREDPLNHFVF